MITSLQKQALINDYANRSFRDIADKDYIAARISHRYGLEHQFLWFALQAVEKYCKAILLYNGKSTKGIEHSILKAYDEVLTIPDIKFDFPDDIRDFIKYLDDEGKNRYFEYPYVTFGKELFFLDKTVWYIRRYCYYLRATVHKPDGTSVDLFSYEIKKIEHAYTLKYPNKYRIFGGFLEKALKNKSSLREPLVWKNFYYGTYKKNKILKYTLRIGSGNPTHYLHPEIFPDLEKLVKFSKPVKNYFNSLKHQKKI